MQLKREQIVLEYLPKCMKRVCARSFNCDVQLMELDCLYGIDVETGDFIFFRWRISIRCSS